MKEEKEINVCVFSEAEGEAGGVEVNKPSLSAHQSSGDSRTPVSTQKRGNFGFLPAFSHHTMFQVTPPPQKEKKRKLVTKILMSVKSMFHNQSVNFRSPFRF